MNKRDELIKLKISELIEGSGKIIGLERLAPLNLQSMFLIFIETVYSLRLKYKSTEDIEFNYIEFYSNKMGWKSIEENVREVRIKGDCEKKQFRERFEESSGFDPLCFIYGDLMKTWPEDEKVKYFELGADLQADLKQRWEKARCTSSRFWKTIEGRGKNSQLMKTRNGRRFRSQVVEELLYKTQNVTHRDKMAVLNFVESSEYKKIHGIGDIGLCYLRMLLGRNDLCKPDINLKRYLLEEEKTAGFGNVMIQRLMERLCDILIKSNFKYSDLTVRELDYMIWNEQRKLNKEENKDKCSSRCL